MNLGVDLGGSKIEVVVIASNNNVLWRQRQATPKGNYQATVNTIKTMVEQAKRQTDMELSAPVGIGTPGVLAYADLAQSGRMKNCNSVVLNGQPLLDDLTNALGCQVSIANDANCFALAETLSGQGQQYFVDEQPPESVFGVILGTGVGGGVVVQGKILQGLNSIGGEWGHNPLPVAFQDEVDRPCYCGRNNCVETFLSGPGLSLSYYRQTGENISGEQLLERVRYGEADAQRVWQQYRQQLAAALAQVVNILDPTLIVLGGGISAIPELYDDFTALMAPHIFSDTFHTPVLPNLLGDSAGVFGAAWLTR